LGTRATYMSTSYHMNLIRFCIFKMTRQTNFSIHVYLPSRTRAQNTCTAPHVIVQIRLTRGNFGLVTPRLPNRRNHRSCSTQAPSSGPSTITAAPTTAGHRTAMGHKLGHPHHPRPHHPPAPARPRRRHRPPPATSRPARRPPPCHSHPRKPPPQHHSRRLPTPPQRHLDTPMPSPQPLPRGRPRHRALRAFRPRALI